MSNMNLNTLPPDPLAKEEEAEKPQAKPKRTRRSKPQMIADDKAAVDLGFKDHKDRVKQEAKIGEAKAEQKVGDNVDDILESIIEKTAEIVVEHLGLPTDTIWNLSGHSYKIVYSDKDTVVFKKCPPDK